MIVNLKQHNDERIKRNKQKKMEKFYKNSITNYSFPEVPIEQ